MDKKKFIKLLNSTLETRYNEKSDFQIDSLDILKIVEMNNNYFKKENINVSKINKCSNIRELLKIYKIK